MCGWGHSQELKRATGFTLCFPWRRSNRWLTYLHVLNFEVERCAISVQHVHVNVHLAVVRKIFSSGKYESARAPGRRWQTYCNKVRIYESKQLEGLGGTTPEYEIHVPRGKVCPLLNVSMCGCVGGKGELFCSPWSDFSRGVRSLMRACPTRFGIEEGSTPHSCAFKKSRGLKPKK